MITPYGRITVIKVIIISLLLIVFAFISGTILKIIFLLTSIFLMLFTLYFFRDPERKIPSLNKGDVISPADGKVVLIKNIRGDGNFFDNSDKLVQISIFLSPLNVHVNRFPISGRITYFKYIQGRFIAAFEDNASEQNERTEIGIETNDGLKILFKQIAGFIARRIICPVEIGDHAEAGERFGMIKFGSRMDLIFKDSCTFYVKVGDKVTAGVTKIVTLKNQA